MRCTCYIQIPNCLVTATLFFLLLSSFSQSAMASDEANIEPDIEPAGELSDAPDDASDDEAQNDLTHLRNRLGFQTSLLDISTYSDEYTVDMVYFSADVGAFYEWEASPNFALGAEFIYSRPLAMDSSSSSSHGADVFRLGARLRAKLPVAEDKVELFALVQLGIAAVQKEHRESYFGGNIFGGFGLTWWIKPSWGLSMGIDAGADIPSFSSNYLMIHMFRVPIEVIYRF